MRICLVSQEYPPDTARGGIGSQTHAKAQALAARGHDVDVLSSAASLDVAETVTVEDGGVRVHRIPLPDRDVPVYEPATYWLAYAWNVLRELERLRARQPFDVVDVPEYGGEAFAYLLERGPWNAMPVVVQLHGPLAMFAHRIGWPELTSDLYRVGTFMEDLCIRRADALMACSANIADFTAQHHHVARDDIAVVHCGVDDATFTPGPPPEGDPLLLFVGNVAENKGLRTVMDAFLRLRADHPRLRLRVLGRGDDDLAAELVARARAGGADAFVEIGGFVDDRAALPAHYRAATAFCSPAQHEVGVANVYLEAMACGCPVLAGTTGAAREAVVDGETGFLVDPGHAEATVAALDRLLREDGLREAMGRAGRARVESYFAVDRYIERVLAVYERAIARAPDGAPA